MLLLGDFCCCRSFAETISRLLRVLQSKLLSGPAVSEKDYVIRLLYNAIEIVHSVRTLKTIVLLPY